MHLLDRIRAAADRATARLALVGADPLDDEDLRARKALLVLISVLILPVAALWGALYLAFGSPVGVVPLLYFGILFGAIGVFSRTRDFSWLLRVGQVALLVAPSRSAAPSCSRCSPCSPASAAMRWRRPGRSRPRPKTSCSTSCRARSPTG